MTKNKAQNSKTRPAKSVLRNRFHRRAKLSEYKFLHVLKAFSDDQSASDAAAKTRISIKTVRSLYAGFRKRLIAATINDPFAFGGAGRFLLDNGKLGDRGRRFLAELAKSETYVSHIKRHDFRFRTSKRYTDELYECAVRAFCSLAMRRQPEDHYPPETVEALKTFREIAAWIVENQDHAAFLEEREALLTRFDTIIETMPRLLEKEDLLALKTHAEPHRFAENVLYDDLRRHLLKHPL